MMLYIRVERTTTVILELCIGKCKTTKIFLFLIIYINDMYLNIINVSDTKHYTIGRGSCDVSFFLLFED